MFIENIEIKNYRNIIEKQKFKLSEYCVLLGKNNEGKTNIFNAMNLALSIMTNRFLRRGGKLMMRSSYHSRERNRDEFNFDRDYPISIQNKYKDTNPTEISIFFKLSVIETERFQNHTGLYNNGVLGFRLSFYKDLRKEPKISMLKRGFGEASYQKKLKEISDFVFKNFFYTYIPAVRTTEESIEIITRIIGNEMSSLSGDPEYIAAQKILNDKKKSLLEDLSKKIQFSLKTFLPKLKQVEISSTSIDRDFSYFSGRDIEFKINDGALTELSYKGDGIISIVTLALIQMQRRNTTSSLLLVEEPESHLHPEAMRQIDNILKELSRNTQIVISTHNPIFTNTLNIGSNIIVDSKKAVAAKNIQTIRQVLGIALSDNLMFAEVVILVEGESDVRLFKHIFSEKSKKISNAFENNRLIIQNLHGASKLKERCTMLKSSICKYIAILDSDKSGKEAMNEALGCAVLNNSDGFLLSPNGNNEAELEDLIESGIISEFLHSEYSIPKTLNVTGKKKWSDECKTLFNNLGMSMQWDENKIKEKLVSKLLSCDINLIFNSRGKPIIDNLVSHIESMFK